MLHINDLFDIIDLQLHQIEKFDGQTFNIGGGRNVSASLLELTHFCQEITGNKIPIDAVHETRKADIRIYLSDCTRFHKLTGWAPKIMVKPILEDIFLWIRDNEQQLKPILG
jgi:CDP-paratose 2-epimerase